MEKRFVVFIVLTMILVVGYNLLVARFGPKRPPANPNANAKADPQQEKKELAEAREKPDLKALPEKERANTNPNGKPVAEVELPADKPQEKRLLPHRVLALGSFQSKNGSPLLVTLNSRGAALERVELVGRDAKGDLIYRDLDNMSGYLGNLSLAAEASRGCRVQVVPEGTPAASAESDNKSVGPGLKIGDIVTAVNGKRVMSPQEFDVELARLKPKQVAKLDVLRTVDGQLMPALHFSATLGVRPFQMIQPEPLEKGELQPHPLSMLVAMRNAGSDQGEFLNSLRDVDWEVTDLPGNDAAVEFKYEINSVMAKELGLTGPIAVVKRFRLGTTNVAANAATRKSPLLPYHIDFDLEFRNLDQQPQKIAYQLDGTNGLPIEGWWYLAKINRAWFTGAGARDVIVRTDTGVPELIGCPVIFKRAKKDEKSPNTPLFGENEHRALNYIGVDTQYFAAALRPVETGQNGRVTFARAEALVVGDISKKPKKWERTANISYRVMSEPVALESNATWRQSFTLFTGPKEPELLGTYRLGELIYYGSFEVISKFLGNILHFFHNKVFGNYALAIIMLTVLVRGCMFPISRKAAKNAAMMQELAPEMKKIAEKYKNNLEARGKAQKELFAKHNYNPLGGCWLMFLQLPVFMGLYRCLAVDIELRQAPLIRGLEWCSNLAGPDKLFYWKSPFFSWFTDETGWLGPYFNLLPIFTIALFLVQQKMFTPPATDENAAFQMKMMKVMTVMMGVLFYKVPAGLCIYFITSSLWGIAERKLLPKPKPPKPPTEEAKPSLLKSLLFFSSSPKDNGSDDERRKFIRKQKRK